MEAKVILVPGTAFNPVRLSALHRVPLRSISKSNLLSPTPVHTLTPVGHHVPSHQTQHEVSSFVRAAYSSASDEEMDTALGRLAKLLDQ
jgi:hypothetical protein